MAVCTNCGATIDGRTANCPNCGAPVAAVNPRADGYPPGYGANRPGYRRPDPFLSGDWPGALLAIATGVAAMIVQAMGSLVLLDLGQDGGFPAITFFAGTATLVCLAFGGALTSGPGLPGDTSPISPLSLALVGFGLIGYVFVRRLRRAGVQTLAGTALQAARVALVGLGVLISVSGVGQLNQDSSGLAGLNIGGAPDHPLTPDIASTLGVGVVWLLIALFLAAVLGLPGALGGFGSGERVRGALAAGLRGVFASVVAACVLTAVFLAVRTALDVRGLEASQAVGVADGAAALALIDLPNFAGGLFLISLGVPTSTGVALGMFGGVAVGPTGADQVIRDGQDHVSVVDLIQHQPRFWFLVAGAVLVVAVGAYVAARHRPPTMARARGVAWFGGVFAGAMFLFVFLIGIGASGHPLTGNLTDRFGFNPFLVFVFSAFWAIAGALAMLRVPPRIRPMPHAPQIPDRYPQ
jgi:hypothetical protein